MMAVKGFQVRRPHQLTSGLSLSIYPRWTDDHEDQTTNML
jgi:hypothetical protein